MSEELINSNFFFESLRHNLNKIYDNINPMIIETSDKFDFQMNYIFIQMLPYLKEVLGKNLTDTDNLLYPLFKQKTDKLIQLFESFISGEEIEKSNLSRAKINLLKFKVLYAVQTLIINHREISKENEKKKYSRMEIFNEFNSLKMFININTEYLNDHQFSEFFKTYICLLPENFLMLPFIEIFTIDLELEEDLIKIFLDKCRENEETNDKKNGKKRLFSELQKESPIVNININIPKPVTQLMQLTNSDKKKKTIDNYFQKSNKELGFRNVKELINNFGSSSELGDKNKPRENINIRNNNVSSSISFNMCISSNENPISNVYDLESFSNIPGNFSTFCENPLNEENIQMNSNTSNTINSLPSSMNLFANFNSTNSQKIKLLTYNSNNNNISVNTNSNNRSTNYSNLSSILSNSKMNQFEYNPNSSTNANSCINVNNSNINSLNQLNALIPQSMHNTHNGLFNSISQHSDNSNPQSLNNHNHRSYSQTAFPRGISSRLAGNNIQIIANTKKQKTASTRRKGNLKIVDQMLEKINKAQIQSKKKQPDNLVDGRNRSNSVNPDSNSNNLKKIINKKFYAKEKELKTPSPLKATITKYSKRKVEDSDITNATTNPNSNIVPIGANSTSSLANENSNINLTISNTSNLNNIKKNANSLNHQSNTNSSSNTPLSERFSVLKSNKNNIFTNKKENLTLVNSDCVNIPICVNVKDALSFNSLSFDSNGVNNNVIILNKLKSGSKSNSENEIKKIKSGSKSDLSEDEILVMSTPTKIDQGMRFGRRSPNVSSRMNLMNLFKQIKHEN